MDSRLVLAMLADARLPTGAHAQSAGLEPMVLGGLADDEVVAHLRTRLATVTATEAGTAVLARRAWLGAQPGAVEEVGAHWAARTPSHHARASAERLGRGYARLALRLWPAPLSYEECSARRVRPDLRHPRPVVLGIIAAVTGLGAADLVRLVAYDDIATTSAAALKLMPLDPLETAGWLLDLEPDVAVLVEEVAGLVDPLAIPAAGAPRLDQLVGAHAHAPRRLFYA